MSTAVFNFPKVTVEVRHPQGYIPSPEHSAELAVYLQTDLVSKKAMKKLEVLLRCLNTGAVLL